MLAIRMQRTGRSGHAQFRMIVQDKRFSPTSGRVVAFVGSFDPHSKVAIIDKEKIASYLGNGAQPTDRVAKLLKKEGVKLPSWVQFDADKKQAVKNPDKRRSTRPVEPAKPVEPTAEVEAPTEAEAPAQQAIEEPPVESVDQEAIAAEAEAEPVAEAEAEPEPAPVQESTAEEAKTTIDSVDEPAKEITEATAKPVTEESFENPGPSEPETPKTES